MARVLALSISDLFTRPILTLSLTITLIPIVFWSIVYMLFHATLSSFAHTLIAYVPFATASWIENIASMVLLISLFYQLVLVSIIIGLGFVARRVVLPINEKHYHLEKSGYATQGDRLLAALRSGALFLLLYLLLLPTLFIPGINVAIHLVLWTILLRGALLTYGAGLFMDKDEYAEFAREHRWRVVAMFLLLSVLYLIPVIGVFTAVFQLIVTSHYSLARIAPADSDVPPPV
jgi:CysZ protein